MVKMPYYYDGVLIDQSVTSATYVEASIRLNSLFDPEYPIGGHQPRGYDQWSTMYNKYLVTGMSYSLGFYPSSEAALTSTGSRGLCGTRCFADGEEAAFGDLVDVMELPRESGFNWRRWTRAANTGAYDSNSDRPVYVKGYVSMKSLAKRRLPGQKWPQDFVTVVGNNPTYGMNMMLWAGTQATGTGTGSTPEVNNLPTMLVDIKLIYYVTWIDAAYMADS